jgi:hypothetical protein
MRCLMRMEGMISALPGMRFGECRQKPGRNPSPGSPQVADLVDALIVLERGDSLSPLSLV